MWIDSRTIYAEYIENPHNVAILILAPIAFVVFWFIPVRRYWVTSFLLTTILLLIWPLSGGADNLMMRTSLATYGLVLTCGFILTKGWISVFLVPVLFGVVVSVVYVRARGLNS
jgi:hypothetical protein